MAGFDNFPLLPLKVAREEPLKKIEKIDRQVALKAENLPKNFFDAQINKVIESLQPNIELVASGFYQRLGLDQSKISRSSSQFIELALRRELSNHDWKDALQEMVSSYLYTMPDASIGPFEIRPNTYLRALLLKNNLVAGDDYDDNLDLAVSRKLVGGGDHLLDKICKSDTALLAFEDILKMYIPPKNESIAILLEKNGESVKYHLPLVDSYVFSNQQGQKVSYSHEEMRLMAALAKYQGKGLRFLSPDNVVRVDDKSKEIVLNDKLVLNNVVSNICTLV